MGLTSLKHILELSFKLSPKIACANVCLYRCIRTYVDHQPSWQPDRYLQRITPIECSYGCAMWGECSLRPSAPSVATPHPDQQVLLHVHPISTHYDLVTMDPSRMYNYRKCVRSVTGRTGITFTREPTGKGTPRASNQVLRNSPLIQVSIPTISRKGNLCSCGLIIQYLQLANALIWLGSAQTTPSSASVDVYWD